MRIGLFEDEGWQALLPFTRLRPIWELWWGIDTLAQKWVRYYGYTVEGFLPANNRLHPLYSPTLPPTPLVWINARLLPFSPEVDRWLSQLRPGRLYKTSAGVPIAAYARLEQPADLERLPTEIVPSEVLLLWLERSTDLFQQTGALLAADWAHWHESSAPLPAHLLVRGKENLFLHPTARVGFAVIDAEGGPVWIGPHAEIQDGALLQSQCAIGPHSAVLLGARIRSFTSIGPWCKVGGEVSHATFLGFSNKAHEGFVGHSVIGHWCNIGAGSNTSNLKNTYGPVRLYNPATHQLEETGLQFCGLLMGDYARCGIQTPFTTGCVVDIFANVVGTGFTPKYVPPFFWAEGEVWEIERALETARRMQARRGRTLSAAEETLLRRLWAALTQSPTDEQNA